MLLTPHIVVAPSVRIRAAVHADPGHTVMGELTLFGAAANSAGFEAAIHMVRSVCITSCESVEPPRAEPAAPHEST